MNKKDLNKIENNNILIYILIILFIITFLILSSSYIIDYCLNKNLVLDINNMEKIKNTFLTISCCLNFISAILILIIIVKNKEDDYENYKNYVLVSKDELKEYKEEIAQYKKEIRKLKFQRNK